MVIWHKFINLTAVSRAIGLSNTALHMKRRGRGYQKITPENQEKIRQEYYGMVADIFKLEDKESLDKFIEGFSNFLGINLK